MNLTRRSLLKWLGALPVVGWLGWDGWEPPGNWHYPNDKPPKLSWGAEWVKYRDINGQICDRALGVKRRSGTQRMTHAEIVEFDRIMKSL